ncbi:MAG: hypothetical protein LIO74_06405 [Ruminococcus sp.]|nr:hypothetical protein [Ruminococcus sp.]
MPEKKKILTAKQYRRNQRSRTCRNVLKVLMILTGIVTVFIHLGQAWGWISNANAGDNWPSNYADYGWFMVVGTILLVIAIILVLFHLNWVSIGIGTVGGILCAGMVFLFVHYASANSFYSDLLNMQVKNLYVLEEIPAMAAFVCLWGVGLLQFWSEEAVEKRRKKRAEKDAEAPSILGEL